MLERTFRMYALSLAGGALLLGGATVAAGAMTLPLPDLSGGVTEQSTAAIVTDTALTLLRSSRSIGAAAAGAGTAAGAGIGRGAGAGVAAGGVTGTLMLAAVGNKRGVHQEPATPARRCGHLAQ